MPNYFEKIIGVIYRQKRGSGSFMTGEHPDEEALASFLEDKLPHKDRLLIEKHLVSCSSCAEYVGIQLKMESGLAKEVPGLLLQKVKRLVIDDNKDSLLEIFLKLKEKAIEIIQTSGDVLVGQEFISAPVLRSRRIKDFREEVVILKDLQSIRVEARLKNNNAKSFDLAVSARDKQSQELIRDLRVTLFKGGLELESYASEAASVIFRDILPGVYTAEVTKSGEKVAVVKIKAEI
ncbi:zf-HC2 domain-containing protein [bacterium]|nr:MAG: zf-HC2 domain-containing protein [bacterium]